MVKTLGERLEARRDELERMVAERVGDEDAGPGTGDVFEADRRRKSLSCALDLALAAVGTETDELHAVPAEMLAKMRRAARGDLGLDAALRHCVAAHAAVGDLLIEEAARDRSASDLQGLLSRQSRHLERLLVAVGKEQFREGPGASSDRGRMTLIRKLLAGERADVAELPYGFEVWHLGLVAEVGAAGPLREFATAHDQRLLLATDSETAVWAWLGSRRRQVVDRIADALKSSSLSQFVVAIGHPASGLEGWRLTHRQAAAVFPIALRLGRPLARYDDLGLVASALRDETLCRSLKALYLEPWAQERDAQVLRETLQAYLRGEQNASSAAAVLQVKRHTVRNRLRRLEERLGCPVGQCYVELALALRLDEMAKLAAPE